MVDEVQQQAKTKVITFSSVLGLVTDEYPVDFDQIKQLGLYTKDDFETLKDLFLELLDVIDRSSTAPYYELFDHQTISIRIKDRRSVSDLGTEVELESTKLRPDEPDFHGSRQNHLFYVDAVAIIIGLARTLQNNFFPDYLKRDYLKEFSNIGAEDYYLKSWGAAGGKTYLSQESIQRKKQELSTLCTTVGRAFIEIEENLKKEPAEATKDDEQGSKPHQELDSAKVPDKIAEIVEALVDAKSEGGDTNQATSKTPPVVNLEDSKTRIQLEESKNYVLAITKTALLDQIFKQSGRTLADLPSAVKTDLQILHGELLDIVDRELTKLVLALPQAELAEFLEAGAINARVKVYRKLLKVLFTRSNSFIVLYQEFYSKQIEALAATPEVTTTTSAEAQTLQAQQTIVALNRFISDITTDSDLAEIHAGLKDWESKLRQQFEELEVRRKELALAAKTPTEKVQEAETTQKTEVENGKSEVTLDSASQLYDKTLTDADAITPTLLPADLPSAPIVLTSTQLQQISSARSVQTLTTAEQAVLPTQAGHVIWGTMAQLFPEEALRQNAIPPQLFEKVNAAAIDYLSNLSPAELHKLSKSPSSLIRHIKNLSIRVQQDPIFTAQYQQFQKDAGAPTINRTERIEIEAAWAIENAKYELFTSHNITDDLIFQSEALKKEYIEAEHELEVKVYAYILNLSTQELLELYLNPQKRSELVTQINRALNSDSRFKKELSDLYSELLHFYAERGLIKEQEDLTENIKNTSHYHLSNKEGVVHFVVEDVKQVDAQKLFVRQLQAETGIDSATVLKSTTDVLDSLLITHGSDLTIKMVGKLDTELLGIMFDFPERVTLDNHQTLRQILINYAKVRASNISPSEGTIAKGFLPSVAEFPTTKAAQVRHLEPMQGMAKLVQENGAEKTADATSGNIRKKAQVFDKIIKDQWDRLTIEEAAALHLLAKNRLPEALRDRIERHATDLKMDKDKLPPIFQILDFKGDLATLVKAAEAGRFKYLAFEKHPVDLEPADTPMARAFQSTIATQRLQNQIEYAQWAAQTVERQQQIATDLKTTLVEIERAYVESIQGEPQQVIYRPQQISDLDAVIMGAGIGAGAAAAMAGESEAATQAVPAAAQYDTRANALQNLASGGIRERIAKSGFGKIADTAGAVTDASSAFAGNFVGMLKTGKRLLDSPTGRYIATGLGTGATAWLMYIAGNPAALASLLGSVWFLGPAGILPGLALSSAVAYNIPWLRFPGLDVRMPPNPFMTGSEAAEHSVSGSQSMAQMRGNNTGFGSDKATKLNASANNPTNPTGATSPSPQTAGRAGGPSATNPNGTPSNAANTANGALNYSANPGTAAATTTSAFSIANIGLLAPLLSVIPVFILTIFTIVVISGAFLVDLPIKPKIKAPFNAQGEQASAKYVTVTKTPLDAAAYAAGNEVVIGDTPNEIPNDTAKNITYKIVITPKPGYTLKINTATDVFSSFGIKTVELTSPFDSSKVPIEPTQTASAPLTYTLSVGRGFTDAFVTNTFTIGFDVMDSTGNIVESGQTYYAGAYVMVGEPKIGCWPVSGIIYTVPFQANISTHATTDAFDIAAVTGTPIHAPFPGTIVDKGWDTTGYGNLMTLTFTLPGDTTARVVFFAHLSGVADKFKEKQGIPVAAGEVVGFVGSTGNSTGPHLHYELKNGRDKASDPGIGIRNIVPNGVNTKNNDRVKSCP